MPGEGERWFVKTEQFVKPFAEVKPHLEARSAWISQLREDGAVVTSGYRVDAEGKPGGGGMMFFAARECAAAEALVLQDPLIVNAWPSTSALNGAPPKSATSQVRRLQRRARWNLCRATQPGLQFYQPASPGSALWCGATSPSCP